MESNRKGHQGKNNPTTASRYLVTLFFKKINTQTIMAKQNKTSKLIHLSEDIKIKLQIKAIKKGKDLKNYIQDLLINHAS